MMYVCQTIAKVIPHTSYYPLMNLESWTILASSLAGRQCHGQKHVHCLLESTLGLACILHPCPYLARLVANLIAPMMIGTSKLPLKMRVKRVCCFSLVANLTHDDQNFTGTMYNWESKTVYYSYSSKMVDVSRELQNRGHPSSTGKLP